MTPDRDGRWVFDRDRSYDDDLDRVTWVAADGIRYQRPAVTLAFKAALDRQKDRVDLTATLPLLDESARRWLRDMVAHIHPRHAWLPRLASST